MGTKVDSRRGPFLMTAALLIFLFTSPALAIQSEEESPPPPTIDLRSFPPTDKLVEAAEPVTDCRVATTPALEQARPLAKDNQSLGPDRVEIQNLDCGQVTPVPCHIASEGMLTNYDCQLSSGRHYDVYTFDGVAGATVQIDMISNVFDTYLYLFSPNGTLVMENDDFGGGLNSRITFTLTSTGVWSVRASSFANQTHNVLYTVTVTGAACSTSCPPRRATISCGHTVAAALTSTDCVSDAKRYDYFRFAGVAGQRLTIDLTSSVFDTFLYLIHPNGSVYQFNDDGGEGLNSRIVTTLNATGTWTIMPTSFLNNVMGVYSLQVSCARAKDDFNGDGRDDLIWRHTSGQNAFWFLDAAGVRGGGALDAVSDLNWRVAGTGDFDGDSRPDILWHHHPTNTNSLWFMNGEAYWWQRSVADANAPWEASGDGDFDGNGSTDIVWRHSVTGENAIWFMNGVSVATGGPIATVSDINWRLIGAGDLDGDARADLLWWHQPSGHVTAWLMHGLLSSSVYVGQVADTMWRPSAVADANGDGRADIIWHHAAAGSVAVWFMDGAAVTGGGFVGGVSDTNWQVVGPR